MNLGEPESTDESTASSNGGMDEAELMAWLEDGGQRKADDSDRALETWLVTGEWPAVKPALTLVHSVEGQAEPEPAGEPKIYTDLDWQSPWRPTAEEMELPVTDAQKQLVAKGLHVAADERLLILTALIGRHPEGITGAEILKAFGMIAPGVTIHHTAIPQWLVDNGLAVILSRNSVTGRHIKLTEDGMAILPMFGHLLDWTIKAGRPPLRTVLGHATEARMPEGGKLATGRQRLEQLDYIFQHQSEIMEPHELIGVAESSEAETRRFIYRLVDSNWLIAIPGPYMKPERYPLFTCDPLLSAGSKRGDFKERFAYYLTQMWQADGQPINLHTFATDPRRLRRFVPGDRMRFRMAIFGEYARLRESGLLHEVRKADFPKRYLVVNPYYLVAIEDLINVVRGGEVNTDAYQLAGRQKLFHLCVMPSAELLSVAKRAHTFRNT